MHLNIPVVLKRLNVVIMNFTSGVVIKRRDATRLTTTSFIGGFFGLIFVTKVKFSCKLAPVVKKCFTRGRCTGTNRALGGDLYVGLVIKLLLDLYVLALLLGVRVLGRPRRLVPCVIPCCVLRLFSIVFTVLFGSFGRFDSNAASAIAPVYIVLKTGILGVVKGCLLVCNGFKYPRLKLAKTNVSALTDHVLAFKVFYILFTGRSHCGLCERKFGGKAIGQTGVNGLIHLNLPINFRVKIRANSFDLDIVVVK